MARTQAEKQLFDILVTHNFDPQSLDSQGKPAQSPEDARLFSFDYEGESGKDYGTVVIMIDDDNGMTVFTGDNTGKSMEGDDKSAWFDFQAQLKRFAMKNLMSFNLQNLNKLKYSMQGQAALAEGLFESWQGKRDVSYNADATQARLMIKHKRNIGEGEARYRNIQALFIETADGERFKLPFNKLSGGRAMLEHVRQGGRPYDMRGAHIANIVNEMNLLARFKRANQSRIFEGEVANLVEQANNYYATLQHSLKSLGSKTGYTKYFETWNPADITDEDVIIEDLRHMFVEQNIDARVEQALPLLAKLQQEQAMKEINVFEGWMNLLSEGTWSLPDSPEKQQQLITLLSQELPVGPDATNATEQLYDILGDDELFDKLTELAQHDANADARTVILNRLEQLKHDPSVAQVIGKLKIEANPQEQPEQPEQDLKEFAPGTGHGDEDHLLKLVRQWAQAGDDYDAQEAVEAALEKFGYGISEIEDGSEAVQLVPTGEYMLDWNDNDIIVFNADELQESCHVCHESKCSCDHEQVEESSDTVEKDSEGKTKSWKHEGDWEKTKKVKGKEVDPRGEVTHMSDKARRETEKLKEGTGRTVADLSDEELDSCIDGSTDLNLVRRLAHLNELDSGGVEVEDFGFDFAESVSNNDSESYEANEEWGQSIANNINELLGAGRHIAELNKDTLGSYIKKASSDRAMRNFDQGLDTGVTFQDREPKFDKENSRKDDQRRKGIFKAVNRLVKETDPTGALSNEAYDSPLDTPDAKAAREKLRQAMLPVKKKHPNHPALKNFKESLADFEAWANTLLEDSEPSMRQRVDIATQDQLDHQDAMSARDFDRNQGRIERHRGNHAAGVDIGRWLKPYQTLVDNNFKPVETEDRFEYLMQVALKLKGTNAGFSGDTGMSHAARMFGLQHEEQKLVANLVRNAPKVSELENYSSDTVAEEGEANGPYMWFKDNIRGKGQPLNMSKDKALKFVKGQQIMQQQVADWGALVDNSGKIVFRYDPRGRLPERFKGEQDDTSQVPADAMHWGAIEPGSDEMTRATGSDRGSDLSTYFNKDTEQDWKDWADEKDGIKKTETDEGLNSNMIKPINNKVDVANQKFPEPRKATTDELRGRHSKSEVIKNGMIYHWQDPRARNLKEADANRIPLSTWVEEVRDEVESGRDIDDVLQDLEARLENEFDADEDTIRNIISDVELNLGDLRYGDDLNEGTALQGQYGHSGKLEAVKPQDADMMDRIKFLAGITK